MTAVSGSQNIASNIDLGNAIVYIGSKQLSLSASQSYTGWHKLGLLKDGAQLVKGIETHDFLSGTPKKLVKKFITGETLQLTGTMAEFSAVNLNRALGNPGIVTTAAGSPSTTVSASPSPTVSGFTVASATGFNVDDEIEVTSGSVKQYGVIQSITGNAIVLYENLDGNAAPSTADAVKLVSTRTIMIGTLAAPNDVALKISKTLAGGYGTEDIYIFDAIANSQVTLNWVDNGNVDAVGIPFQFDAISNSGVESGALGAIVMTQV